MEENNNNNKNQESNSNNKIYQVIVIIIGLIAVALGIGLNSTLNNEENQVSNNTSESVTENEIGEYENLNIDEDELNIFYFYVGQADCTLITINGYTMLIDSGNDSDGYYIVEFLKAQNIEKIDYFILTHYDDDHIGGAYKILEELEIGILYMPNNSSTTQTYAKLLQSIEDNNINCDTTLIASNETTYQFGEAYWKVLSARETTNANNLSLVIELYYNQTNYLFMGDAETTVENDESIEWDIVNVLKVAHHGSDSSTSQDFIDKINPEYAIISVGIDNIYDLPDEKVINILESKSSIKEIYRTDEDGTIWLTSDGIEIEFTKLDYNLDGSGRKQSCLEREYGAFFYSSVMPSCLSNLITWYKPSSCNCSLI